MSFKIYCRHRPFHTTTLLRSYTPTRQLRSLTRSSSYWSHQKSPVITEIAGRAFCQAAPTVWNWNLWKH